MLIQLSISTFPVLGFFAPRINQTQIENRESVNYVHIYLSHRHVWQNVPFTGCQRERESGPIYRSFRLSDESKTETLDSCINSMMEYFFSSCRALLFISHDEPKFSSNTINVMAQKTRHKSDAGVCACCGSNHHKFSLPDTSTFPFFLRPHFLPSLVFCFFSDAKKNKYSRKSFSAFIAAPEPPLWLRPQVRLL